MAVDFVDENSTRNMTFTDSDKWAFSDTADFTLMALLKWDSGDYSGSAYQYWFSTGGYAAANSFNMYIGEATQPTNAHLNQVQYEGVSNTFEPSTHQDNGLWTLMGARNDGGTTTGEVFSLQQGDSAVQSNTTKVDFLSPANGAYVYVGSRSDSDIARYFEGEMQFLLKLDIRVSDDQLLAIANGIHPYAALPGSSFISYLQFDTLDSIVDLTDNDTPSVNGTGYVDTENMPLALGPHWTTAAYPPQAGGAPATTPFGYRPMSLMGMGA